MVFEVFRARQKTMLAGLILVAMVAFVFSGLLSSVSRDRGEIERAQVVAKLFGTPLTAGELNVAAGERESIAEFFDRLAAKLPDRFKYLEAESLYLWAPLSQNSARTYQGRLLRPRDFVLHSEALLRKADLMGVVLDEAAVNVFLVKLSDNALTDKLFHEVLGAGKGRKSTPIGESELIRALTKQLRIRAVFDALTPVIVPILPERVNQSAEAESASLQVETARVPVADFLPKAEPDLPDLEKVYQQYRGLDASDDPSNFGVRRPARAEAEYLSVKPDKFLATVTVTDAEAKDYYDKNPDEFRTFAGPLPTLPTLPPVLTNPASPPKAAPPKAEAPKKEATPKADPSKKADVPKPTEAPKKPEPAKAEPPKKVEPPKTPPAAKGKSASLGNLLAPLTIGYLGQTPPKSEPQKKAEPAPAVPPKKADPPKSEALKKADPPKAEPPKKADPPKAEPVMPLPTSLPSIPGAAPGRAIVPPAATVQPFAEVKDRIVAKLKRQRAFTKALATLKRVQTETMADYAERYLAEQNEHLRKVAEAKVTNAAPPAAFVPPPRPDLKAVAAKEGCGYGTTGLVDAAAAAKLPGVGLAKMDFGDLFGEGGFRQEDRPRYGRGIDMLLFPTIGYGPFRPFTLRAGEDEAFLIWKVAEEAPAAPPLVEVRGKLVAAWRHDKAVEAAKKKADELAAKFKEPNATWAKVLEGTPYKMVPSANFTYLIMSFSNNTGRMEGTPISKVDGVEGSDQRFAQEAFGMMVGDVKVVPDAKGEGFFVVRMAKRGAGDFTRFVEAYVRATQRYAQLAANIRESRIGGHAQVAEEVLREANPERAKEGSAAPVPLPDFDGDQ